MSKDEDINESIDYDNYISIMLFSSIFIFIYIIYLIAILKYILKNCLKNKICVYWIDYSVLIFLGIAFIITYIVNTVLLKKDKKIIRINNLKELSEDSLSLMIIVLLTLMCVTIINSLLFDSINACKLSYKMNKIKKIKETDFLLLSEKLKEINVVNIIKFKYTFWYNLIFFIVDILYSVLFILSFKDIYENNFINEINFHKFFIKSLRYYQVSVLVLLLISIVIMNRTKKSLLKNQYYNKNRIAQKIYNIYLNNLIYFTDIISFKLVSDLIMYIPTLLFLSQGKFHTTTLVISEFSILIYILLGGSFYLVIDKNNKAAKLSKKIKNLFCLKRIDFHFGEKDHNFTLDQTRFDYNLEEQNIINNLNMNVVKNIENNIFDEEDNFTMDEKLELNLDDDNYNLLLDAQNKKLEFKNISEFYLIQKLMILYFQENKNVYESNKNNEDSIYNYSYSLKKQKNKVMNIDKKSYISNIEKLSRISKLDSKKIKPSLKFNNFNVFSTIEEKELYEELKSNFNAKNEKYFFKIENLFSSELYEPYKFYQMKYNSILNSLNPSNNIKIFNKFIDRNKNIKTKLKTRFSVKSEITEDNNDDNSDDNNEYENNLYYTYDSYLMYEIYDIDEFINYAQLKNIITEYKNYLLSVIKNMSYSFIPLILGIFNIEIFNTRKIIILFRNPLYFTNFDNFNFWINFYLTEEPDDKIKVSSLLNDIIDINEIEIKNNLKLNEVDYDEFKKILEKDYNFIKKMKIIFPIIHIFLGIEKINDNGNKEKKIKNQYDENSLMTFSNKDNINNILDILNKNTSSSNYIESDNTDNNNDINKSSLFEKEYYYMSGNDIRTIKFYFTHLFRKYCKLNENGQNNISAYIYCEYMNKKVIEYLSKNSLFKENSEDIIDNKK